MRKLQQTSKFKTEWGYQIDEVTYAKRGGRYSKQVHVRTRKVIGVENKGDVITNERNHFELI